MIKLAIDRQNRLRIDGRTARQTDQSELDGLIKSGGKVAELAGTENWKATANSISNSLLSGASGTTDGAPDSANSAADSAGNTVQGAPHALSDGRNGPQLTLDS